MRTHDLLTRALALFPPLAIPLATQVSWQSNAASGPTAIYASNSATDSTRNRVVLFGGRRSILSVTNQTWEWDGATWTQRQVTPLPPGRSDAAMTFDSARNLSLVLGGSDSNFNPMGDMWSWNGTAWSQLTPSTMPEARGGARMCYDQRRRVVVLFGGLGANSLADTWEWDGSNWSRRNPTTSPPARDAHGMCYDAARGVTVLFGGLDDQVNPIELGDTWEWDGTNWTRRVPPTSPAARWGHSMTFDPIRNRPILVGGSNSSRDTWEWDGQTWISRGANIGMIAHYSTMSMDPVRGLPIVFGSTLSSIRFWEYVTQAPVGFTTYGTGCAGSNGTPRLDRDPNTSALIGATFRLQATSLPLAATSALLTFGLTRVNRDLTPIGMSGCAQLTSADVHLAVTASAGSGSLSLSIPNLTALLGGLLPVQCFVIDPGANALGVTASNGAEIRFGM